MTNFLLIHGPWHGAWMWQGVIQRLEAFREEKDLGEIVAVDLPGHGVRRSDDIRRITREYYVEAAVTPAQLTRLSPLTLVVHSFAATLVPQLVNRLGGTLEQIVFIGGLLPPSGAMPIKALSAAERLRARLLKAPENGLGVPGALGKGVPVRKEFLSPQPEPYLPWVEPADPPQFPPGLALTYIVLTGDRVISPKLQRAHAKGLPGVETVELRAGHQAPMTHPVEIADLLLSSVPPRPPQEEALPEVVAHDDETAPQAVAEGDNE